MITGAERSGTTFLQRFVVTSPSVVPVVGEFPLIPSLLQSLSVADDQYSFFYRDYLNNRQVIWRRGGEFLRGLVDDVFERFPNHPVLALKAPALAGSYKHFRRIFPRSDLIVLCRHPLDAISSLKKVASRARVLGSHANLAAHRDDIAFLTDRFLSAYSPFMVASRGECPTFLRYEALVADIAAAIPILRERHGLVGLRRSLDGDGSSSEYINKSRPELHKAFWSEGYVTDTSSSRVGSFAEVLTEDEVAFVQQRTRDYCAWGGYKDTPEAGGTLLIDGLPSDGGPQASSFR